VTILAVTVGSRTTWSITTPTCIPSQNEYNGWHWSRRHRHSKAVGTQLVRAGALAVPKATGRRWLLVMSYRRQRCRDIANLIGGAKGEIDALVRLGLLKDDCDDLAVIDYDQDTLKRSPIAGSPATVFTLSDQPPA
jgi:hypothetical protein